MKEEKIMSMQKNDSEIVSVGEGVSEKSLETIISRSEKQVEVLKKVLGVAIKRTNSSDWIDQQGKPYLTASGAEKIAPVFGVRMSNSTQEKQFSEDDKGQYYMYILKATFSWAGGSIEAIGTCTSRDQFFAKKGGEWKKLSEIDESNILKAAYSNLTVNGITRLLGIRNLIWDDLKAFGISKDRVAKVEYQNGNKVGKYLISEAQGKRLYAISKKSGLSADEMKAYLKKHYGIDSSKDIQREWYEEICRVAEQEPNKIKG